MRWTSNDGSERCRRSPREYTAVHTPAAAFTQSQVGAQLDLALRHAAVQLLPTWNATSSFVVLIAQTLS
jgi:hypothetical protein